MRDVIPRYPGMIAAGDFLTDLTASQLLTKFSGYISIHAKLFLDTLRIVDYHEVRPYYCLTACLSYCVMHIQTCLASFCPVTNILSVKNRIGGVFHTVMSPKRCIENNICELTPLYSRIAEYGGNLAGLEELDDPLRHNHALPNGLGQPPSTNSITSVSSQPVPLPPIRISPTSLQNPFFGYPTLSNSTQTTPFFQPRRRRLRDLLCTLANMWWDRWGIHVSVLLWLVLAIAGARIWVKRGSIARLGRGVEQLVRWRDLWLTGLG
jgi:hypothetical protein